MEPKSPLLTPTINGITVKKNEMNASAQNKNLAYSKILLSHLTASSM